MGKFSKLGFILATLGSSIGLGHIWRFPYMVGHNGGSAFVLLYLVLTLSLGIAMLLVEMLIGNLGKKDVVSNYQILDPKRKNITLSLLFYFRRPSHSILLCGGVRLGALLSFCSNF